MSADNFYRIHIHPLGGYAAVMEFASDQEEEDYVPRKPIESDRRFDTLEQAYQYAMGEMPEYGVSISPEVLEQASKQNIVS